jgi:uncharacterized protein YndB with AHSA1/START domain
VRSVIHTVEHDVGAERAFAAFADLGAWWPAEYSWAGDVLEEIGIEPREGGHCYELGPHGIRCDWGRVTAWEPPRRLVFTWQIGPQREPAPDPARASEVEVRFDATTVTLEHRDFERHGPDAENYRAALASEHGWPYILGRYAATLSA